MLVYISCLKVFDEVTRLGVGCNLDPLGSKKVVVIVYVCVILDCQGSDVSVHFKFETRSFSSEVGGWVQLRPSWLREGGRDSICGPEFRLLRTRLFEISSSSSELGGRVQLRPSQF